jgi:hypothetical protein
VRLYKESEVKLMQSCIRHLCCVLLVLLISSAMTGCSRAELLNYLESRDTKHFREMMDKVFETFDTGDEEGLKNLFSVNVRNDNPDLDMQIESFFEVYNSPTEIEEIRYSTSGGEHVEYGKRRTDLYNSYDIIIKAGGIRYYIAVEFVSIDDFDPDNEGIQTLNIATEEAHESEYFVNYYSNPNRGGDNPGLYYQDSTEMRDDIRWIEGRPWRYTNFERKLTVDELVSVVEIDDDYNNLVSVLGEPNCSWNTYAYYYFELENGLFAVCKIEDIHQTIRPRVDGRVARPDVVVAIYIADEEENLETVWMADDIVQVLGGYYSYFPVERELAEEFFASFILRSKSLSLLKDEIGLPNIDTPMYWRCFYEIEDHRYIECKFLGDDIKGLSVVDSENKLYTIWEPDDTEN